MKTPFPKPTSKGISRRLRFWKGIPRACPKELQRRLRQIARKFGVTLVFATATNYHDLMFWDSDGVILRQWSEQAAAWPDYRLIKIGFFENDEDAEISFFHELGHLLAKNQRSKPTPGLRLIHEEVQAWEIGLRIAEQHGYHFSSKSVSWAFESLQTHVRNVRQHETYRKKRRKERKR